MKTSLFECFDIIHNKYEWIQRFIMFLHDR